MLSSKRNIIFPVILFLAALGFQVSGYENTTVGYTLWGLAVLSLLLFLITWPRLGLISGATKDIEVIVSKSKYSDESPFYRVFPGSALTAIFKLEIVNHNTSYKLNIKSIQIALQTRRWFGRKQVLFSVPLEELATQGNHEVRDIVIEPQAKPIELHILTTKGIPVIRHFPRKSRLMLVLELVGPVRRVEYKLHDLRHDPKNVPDSPITGNEIETS